VKERLEAAKSGSTRGLAGGGAANGGAQMAGNGALSRIAKPLRGGGGGGGAGDAPVVPTFAGLQQAQQNEGGKRGSWFFNQRT